MSVLRVLLLASMAVAISAKKIHYIHWNKASPMFRIDNTDHIVDVKEFDQVNIICPVAKPGNGLEGEGESHVIYSVTREEYEACRITNPKPKIVAICNQPSRLMYFTITFRAFTPTPGGLEFAPGQDYYFISTSTASDLHRRVGGGCSSHNMKMVFKVREDPEAAAVEEIENSIDVDAEEERFPRYQFAQPQTTSTTASPPSVFYYHPRDVISPLHLQKYGKRTPPRKPACLLREDNVERRLIGGDEDDEDHENEADYNSEGMSPRAADKVYRTLRLASRDFDHRESRHTSGSMSNAGSVVVLFLSVLFAKLHQ